MPGHTNLPGHRTIRLADIDDHWAAKHIAGILTRRPDRLLVVCQERKEFYRALVRMLRPEQATRWNSSVVRAPAFEQGTFDCVVSLDVLSMLPGSERDAIYCSIDTVATCESLVCELLGTDYQKMILESVLKHIVADLGVGDPETALMLSNGLPTPDDAFSWSKDLAGIELFYAGNIEIFQTAAENRIHAAKRGRLLNLIYKMAGLDNPVGGANDLEPETVPMRRHRRIYLHRTRG